ncbi:MAG: SAM hydrolase/SAM-dependent halogenase family protein [Conexivisphaera sp.]
MRPSGLIVLLTDFGTSDYFVASMKGIIARMSPTATIVDLSHEVPPFNVRRGAFLLWKAYKWFPVGTVFVGVVDPGVGSSRKALLIVGRNYYFIGPDNGLLTLAAREDGVERVIDISALSPSASSTFHGRDLFAPAAAMIVRGADPGSLGPPATISVWLDLGAASLEGNALRCSVVYVDRFGNAFTDFTGDPPWPPGTPLEVELPAGRRVPGKRVRSYSDVGKGEVAVLVNSEGHLELAIREGNFAASYFVAEGDGIVIRPR